MSVICGIDYSIASPAACFHDTMDDFSIDTCEWLAVPPFKKGMASTYLDGHIRLVENLGSKANQMERFELNCDYIVDECVKRGVTEVLIEDYSMGSKGKVFHIGENCGILKYKLWKNGIDAKTLAPTALKKFILGIGKGDKNVIYDFFCEDTGLDLLAEFGFNRIKKLQSPIDDLVDAYYLTKYLKELSLEK